MSYANGLNEAQEERLYILAEECAEVIKEIQKVLRFGFESVHPHNPTVTNRTLLTNEMGDLKAAMALLTCNGDIMETSLNYAAIDKNYRMQRFVKFSHNYGAF